MYNRKLVTLTCLVAVLTLASFTAQAQLGGLGKKKAAAGSGVDVTAQQDKLVKEYSAGGALLSEAVALTIEALSSKEIADKYRAEAKDVIGGTSKDPKHVHKVLEGGIKQADELIAKAGELSAEQKKAMQALSRQVMALLELRRVSARMAEALDKVRTLHELLPICAWCKRIRDDHGYWKQVEAYIHEHTGADFTHGICPECLAKQRPKKGPAE